MALLTYRCYRIVTCRRHRRPQLMKAAIILCAQLGLLLAPNSSDRATDSPASNGVVRWRNSFISSVFVSARVRKRYFGGDIWVDSMWSYQAAMYNWFKQKSPIYFYDRSCGEKSKGARLLLAKIKDWKINEILAKGRVKTFLLHLRFLLETYGWKIVRDREKEPRYILVLDFENMSVTSLLRNWVGIYHLFKFSRPAVKAAPISWSKAVFLNAPYVIQKTIDYGKALTPFRFEDITIPKSPKETSEAIRELVGRECLASTFGGYNSLPLNGSDAEQAFQDIVLEGTLDWIRRQERIS